VSSQLCHQNYLIKIVVSTDASHNESGLTTVTRVAFPRLSDSCISQQCLTAVLFNCVETALVSQNSVTTRVSCDSLFPKVQQLLCLARQRFKTVACNCVSPSGLGRVVSQVHLSRNWESKVSHNKVDNICGQNISHLTIENLTGIRARSRFQSQ
jgi:hypothetical protein